MSADVTQAVVLSKLYFYRNDECHFCSLLLASFSNHLDVD